jgi:AAA15 family ATPase/GTPase
MADWMINTLRIENFKSIKELELKPKRVNVFVGKPNTGKSNILEALSISSVLPKGDLKDFIRFEKLRHLFYDGNIQRKVYINAKTNYKSHVVSIEFIESEKNYRLLIQAEIPNMSPEKKPNDTKFLIENETNVALTDTNTRVESEFVSIFKKYSFRKEHFGSKDASDSSLRVPFGENLYYVLETNPSLFEEVAPLFEQYGLSLVLNQENDSMLIQKKVGHRVYQLPYSLVADTLQRLIFYLAAIKTNSQSILIFEEPETHSFPPYIAQLATAIAESRNNQFFITTHSPYLFNTIIEDAPKEEVAIFVVDYEKYQSVVHQVPEEDYGEIIDYGIDIFFNIRRFTEKEIEQ